MIINPQKSVYQLFTLSTKYHDLIVKIQDQPISRTNEAKYLGLLLDNKLTWAKRSERAAAKAVSRLRLMKTTAITWGESAEVLRTAYTSYIRPVLEYGSSVMVTATDPVLRRLEMVQNKALRVITEGTKSTPILAMQLQDDIESLKTRRERNAITSTSASFDPAMIIGRTLLT